ncbi:MAG TPA: hypothetical protein VIY54_10635 [Steroidobacteraceae bacterium]
MKQTPATPLSTLTHLVTTALALLLGSMAAFGADGTAPPDGTIAYVLTDLHWAIYESADGKTECPHGFNEGNREQFKQLFPEDGTQRTLLETQLRREIDGWYPTTAPDPFPFLEAGGPTAYGLNLDGKVGPNDFTSPDGEKGVDNQLYRALGCIRNYRPPEGAIQGFDNDEVTKDVYNRILIELSGVDSLVNDADVQVTMYRGRDPILLDATGKKAIPGGSQRIDTRWGAKYIQHLHGRIKDGVLTTDPVDLVYPWAVFYIPTDEYMRAARLRLKLSPTTADGLIAGYTDIETWYSQLMRSYSTHHQSYGQSSAPSIYKAFRRLADAYPDPKTGANTAISSALLAKFTQVRIVPESKAQLASLPPQHPVRPYAGPPYPRPAAEEATEGGAKVAAVMAGSGATH